MLVLVLLGLAMGVYDFYLYIYFISSYFKFVNVSAFVFNVG
jgi:hypothetical protein